MTATTEIRCTGPHPLDPRRQCRAKLGVAVEGTVDITPHRPAAPGCVLLQCRRCGTTYLVCPVAA